MNVAVKERPIILSDAMVRATLREVDAKTKTRRLMKTEDLLAFGAKLDDWTFEKMADEYAVLKRPGRDDEGVIVRCALIKCPYGVPCDRLWVREKWAQCDCGVLAYAANGKRCAACRLLSVEPMLERIDLHRATPNKQTVVFEGEHTRLWPTKGYIDWVIAGGESGPGARPMQRAWAQDMRDQCNEAGIAFFFKQWGGSNKKLTGRVIDGREWNDVPACLKVSA